MSHIGPFSLGLDIGGTSVKATLMRDRLAVGAGRSARYDRPDAAQLEHALREAIEAAGGFNANVGVGQIGLCAPGLLDATGKAIERSVNVPGIVGVPLKSLVARAVGATEFGFKVVSDVHAAAHDVWATQSLRARLLVVALGTGVGAIVLDEGQPLQVSGSSSGHLGQVDVSLDDQPPVPVGPDGGRGGLEAYIGLRALHSRYGPGLSGFPASVEQPPMRALVRALRVAHAIYRPQHIRLVGGVGLLMGPKTAQIHAAIADGLTSLARADWTLGVGVDLFHAARGAALLAGEKVR